MISSANYRLRAFEPQNMGDIERINLMFYHPQVMKAKGYFRQGYVVESQADLHYKNRVMFRIDSHLRKAVKDITLAVTDLDSGVLGWIWFYHDSRHPLPKRVQSELGLTKRNSRIYQLSYEKLISEGWPAKLLNLTRHVTPEYLKTERKGVIVEGLRLAIDRLRREFRALYPKSKKLVFYAFVSHDNIPSQKVLDQNKFIKIERKYKYDGEMQDLWVKVV